jgi:integrase
MSGTGTRPATGGLTIEDLIEVVGPSIRQKQKDSSAVVTLDMMRRFARYCELSRGIVLAAEVSEADVEAFVRSRRAAGGDAPLGTLHSRRTAVRTLFAEGRALGLVEGDPTLDIELDPRPEGSTRPLLTPETERCRLAAEPAGEDLRLPTIWACAECSARSSEIDQVRVRDVDLRGERVHLVGGTRMDPRWSPMTPWARNWLGRRLAQLGPDPDPETRLVPWTVLRVRRPSNATTMAIIEVLRAAGVHDDPDVHPLSVTGWAGARLYFDEDWPIEDVALALGTRSLDAAARMIGLDWRPVPRPEEA